MKPKYEVTFAPGAFDDFEGTQEELDALIKEITRMIESGEFVEQVRPVSNEELENLTETNSNRKIQ